MTLRASGHNDLRVASLFGSVGEPTHIAMKADLKKLRQPFPGFGTEFRLTETDGIKADPQGVVADSALWDRLPASPDGSMTGVLSKVGHLAIVLFSRGL